MALRELFKSRAQLEGEYRERVEPLIAERIKQSLTADFKQELDRRHNEWNNRIEREAAIAASAQNYAANVSRSRMDRIVGTERLGINPIFAGFQSAPTAAMREYLTAMESWTHVCVEKLARVAGKVDSKGYKLSGTSGQDEKKELPYGTWLPNIIRKPHPRFARSSMRWNRLRWLFYSGNPMSYTAIGKSGMPEVEHPLPPTSMFVIADPDYIVKEYWFWSPSGVKKYKPWEICHVMDAMPSTDFIRSLLWGTAYVEKIWLTASVDRATQEYLKNAFEQEWVPPVYVATDKELSDPQYQKFAARFVEKYNRTVGVGGMALLEGGMKLATVDAGASRLRFFEMDQQNAKHIAAAVGVSLSLVLGEHANKATAQVTRDDFRVDTVDSHLTLIDEHRTLHWQNYEENVAEIHDEIRPVDNEYQLNQLKTIVGLGGKSMNEIRKENGDEPWDDPRADEPMLDTTLQFAFSSPDNAATKQGEPAPAEGQGIVDAKTGQETVKKKTP